MDFGKIMAGVVGALLVSLILYVTSVIPRGYPESS